MLRRERPALGPALGLLFALAGAPFMAQAEVSVVDRHDLPVQVAPGADLTMRLALATIEGSGWLEQTVHEAVKEAASILLQCGIGLSRAELLRIRAPDRYLDFSTPVARQLSLAVPLPRPTVWFVRDTRQRPAFDAEAIGRGNSRTRPELTDTVWVTKATRDLGIAIAHELAHVLMDSGEHSDEPGNLMREETAPGGTGLSVLQCRRMRETATRHGLLQSRP